MPSTGSNPVYDYLDYRQFLRDYYEEKKANSAFSYRAFSQRARLRSPNYLKLVMDGDRNLSDEMIPRFAKACGLEGDEGEYFKVLVEFNQAGSSNEKNSLLKRLAPYRKYRRVHRIEASRSEYHSQWFIPAIRELVLRADFVEDSGWIAARLDPPIHKAEAERAIEVLLTLGMVERNEEGRLVQREALVSTDREVPSSTIANYHRVMMQLAADAIDRVPSGRRDISSLTLCVSPGRLADIKRRLQEFRREILLLSVEDEKHAQVVQLNLQLFPLTTAAVDEEDLEK